MVEKTLTEFTRHLSETIGLEDVKDKLLSGQKLNIYWGTAPTRPPHLAYFLPLIKLADFIRTGQVNVTILIADVHSYLDEGFDSITRVEQRTSYYTFVIREMMRRLYIDDDKYEIKKGSDFQLKPRYILDLLEFTTLISVKQAQRAGTEVVKNLKKEPPLSKILYPLLQCCDEQSLDADIQLGGVDQRKIFVLSRDYADKRGRKKCSYFINPLIPSLNNKGKMSASSSFKIELDDDNTAIQKKINKAWCVDGVSDVTTDPILAMVKYLVFPIFGQIMIKRDEKYGGDVTYHTFEELEMDWCDKKLSSVDLKSNISTCIIDIIAPIRQALDQNPLLYRCAYE